MYCNSCGHKNSEGSNFCSSCGASFHGDDTTITFLTADADGDGDGDGDVEVTLPLDDVKVGQALLVVVKGPNAGSRYMLDGPVARVGRHPESEIFLDDITVSRRHAEFRVDDAGQFTVKDAGSLNGTYVNRERVDEVELVTGDEVQIGRFRMVFYAGEA